MKKIMSFVLSFLIFATLSIPVGGIQEVMAEELSMPQIGSRMVSSNGEHIVKLISDGTVVATGNNYYGQCNVEAWKLIVQVSAGNSHTVGLKNDGTVVAVGRNDDGECNLEGWKDIVQVSAGYMYTVGLKKDGTVVASGRNSAGECDVKYWKDIVQVSAGGSYTVGLKADGTVVSTGKNSYGDCNVENWNGIVQISSGETHVVGLKSDGTVVATGYNNYGECDVTGWNDMAQISAGYFHTVGLKKDGTVVAIGENYDGQCDVEAWKDIEQVSAGRYRTVGLKSDGSVIVIGLDNGCEEFLKGVIQVSTYGNRVVGLNSEGIVEAVGISEYEQKDIKSWTNISQISTGYSHTVGLNNNGTVEAVGENNDGECNVEEWKDIVQVSAGYDYTIGLKKDGTVVSVGNNLYGQCKVEEWRDIAQVSAGSSYSSHTVGLKKDGTVIAVGYNSDGQCNVEEWKDIIQVSAGYDYTIGLKKDGTVVAVGDNSNGECSVGEWKDIKQISAWDYYTVGLKKDGTVLYVGSDYNWKNDVEGWKNIIQVSSSPNGLVGVKADGTLVTAGYMINRGLNSDVKIISDPTTTLIPTLTPTPTIKGKTRQKGGGMIIENTDIPDSSSFELPLIDLGYTNIRRALTEEEILKATEEILSKLNIEKMDSDYLEDVMRFLEFCIEKMSSSEISSKDGKVEVDELSIAQGCLKAYEAKDHMENLIDKYKIEKERDIHAVAEFCAFGVGDKLDINFNSNVIGASENVDGINIVYDDVGITLETKNFESQFEGDDVFAIEMQREFDNTVPVSSEEKILGEKIIPVPETNKEKKTKKLKLRFIDSMGNEKQQLSKNLKLELPAVNGDSEYQCVAYTNGNNYAYIGGNYNLGEQNMMAKAISAGDYFIIEDKKTFNDIASKGPEMKKAIEVLASKGIIAGKGKDTFEPDSEIKRSEFSTLIVKGLSKLDSYAKVDFADVLETAWYYSFVASASKEGLISGYEDNTFRGERIINKQEVVKVCAAALNTELGYYYPQNEDKYLMFADKDSIPNWVRKFVALGNREGLIVKRDDGNFQGTFACTRGNAAIILYRLYKKL